MALAGVAAVFWSAVISTAERQSGQDREARHVEINPLERARSLLLEGSMIEFA